MSLPRLLLLASLLFGLNVNARGAGWQTLDPEGRPHPRHEAAFVECEGKFYLLGGRRIQPVDIYDPVTRRWTHGAPPPVEVHHFQPVVWQGRILLAGAMTGKYPHEVGLPNVLIYDPATDAWSEGPEIPAERRRGGAGAVVHDDTLYLVAGIIDGHWSGHVTWLDALDLHTGTWRQLADAPRARDHFQAGVLDGRIYAGGGRRSSAATKETFTHVEPLLDVYDLATNTWTTAEAPLPVPRAGTFSVVAGGRYLVAGGESLAQQEAHAEVDAYDPADAAWHALPPFVRGRHGAGIIWHDHALWTCSGSGSRGGRPELDSLEVLRPFP